MSFNDFKNNTQILKKYLLKMNSITQSEIKPQWIDQNFLKQNNPHIFLQILHYTLVKFSPSVLFVKVLDFYPTIKDDSDKKFVTNALSLGRKMLQIDVKIDIDQFLSGKFVQKKTEFSSCFCKAAYEFHFKQTKPTFNSKIGIKKDVQLASQVQNKNIHKQAIQEDSEEQNPRNLNLVPSSTKRPIIKKQDMQESSEDDDLQELMNKKKQLHKIKDKQLVTHSSTQSTSMNKIKQNLFPKKLQHFTEDPDDQEPSQPKRIPIQKNITQYYGNNQTLKAEQETRNKKRNQNKQVQSPIIEQRNDKENGLEETEYVTREQFMEIVTGMTNNFTQLLTKFNEFQRQVGGWVQNVNAKISILQENVKTIKNNI